MSVTEHSLLRCSCAREVCVSWMRWKQASTLRVSHNCILPSPALPSVPTSPFASLIDWPGSTPRVRDKEEKQSARRSKYFTPQQGSLLSLYFLCSRKKLFVHPCLALGLEHMAGDVTPFHTPSESHFFCSLRQGDGGILALRVALGNGRQVGGLRGCGC